MLPILNFTSKQAEKAMHFGGGRSNSLDQFHLNFDVLLGTVSLTCVTITQHQGYCRCKSVPVTFGGAFWEVVFVSTGDVTEKRLL